MFSIFFAYFYKTMVTKLSMVQYLVKLDYRRQKNLITQY